MAVQIDGSQGSVIATSGDYSGGVSIGGTLTYEDVTNIDAVGLITARSGIEIGASPGVGASISVDGNAIFSGITTVTGDVSISDKIIHTGDTNTAIRFPSADTVTVETGGTERTRVSDLGLRIGTNAVTANTAGDDVVIEGSSDRGLSIISGSSSSGNIYFGDSGDADIGRIAYQHNSNQLEISTGASNNPVIIDSSGRLGIQGAATKGLLDVRASGGSAAMLTACFGANEGTAAGTLSDSTDKGARVGLYHYDTDEEPYALFSSGATSGTNSINFGGGTTLMNAATSIGFYTAANTTTTSGTQRLLIDSSGRILINTDTAGEATSDTLTIKTLSNHAGVTIRSSTSGSGCIYFADGTSGDAQYRGFAEYVHSSDYLKFGTGGSERLRITSAGAVNIGAASPTASENGQFNCYTTTSGGKPQFVHDAGTGGLRLAGTGAGSGSNLVFSNNYSSGTFSDHWTLTHNGADDSFRFLIGGTGGNEAFRIKSDGSVGILQGGVTATSGAGEVTWPYSPLHVKYYSDTSASASGSYGQYIENYVGSDINQQKTFIGMAFHDDNSNNRPQVKFGAEVGQRGDANTQPKEGSGNFVVYTATGNSNYDDNATEKFVVQYNGTATISGSTVTSDVRLKTDITTLTGALDKVKQLRGVEYLWNDVAIENRGMSNREDGEKQIGVIADEVQSIYPALVDDSGLKGRDGTYYKQVAYERLVPILLEAVKELSAKVEALESI